jgi:hypothetical protein
VQVVCESGDNFDLLAERNAFTKWLRTLSKICLCGLCVNR